jgi:hypothetical protein
MPINKSSGVELCVFFEPSVYSGGYFFEFSRAVILKTTVSLYVAFFKLHFHLKNHWINLISLTNQLYNR